MVCLQISISSGDSHRYFLPTKNAFSLFPTSHLSLNSQISEEDKIFTTTSSPYRLSTHSNNETFGEQKPFSKIISFYLSPMRCKRHTVDLSSNIGVCSSCLRERLLSLAASAAATAALEDHNRQPRKSKSNNNPPLLIFPRSVSPYVTRRKSDAGGDLSSSNRRFITTPQVDLGYSCKDFESNRRIKSNKRGKFSRFSNLFRIRSEDSDSNPRISCDASETSSSWISNILTGGRRKQPTTACYIEDVIAGRRPQRIFCRGMSPARETEPENEHESIEESPGISRRTPAKKTPGRRKIATGIGKGMSGMAFCLSPLVRASPNCPFRRKIRFPSEFGNSGEITAPEKPHISEAASFCANRSKKLVDLGRVDRRR